jgi:hypothetical protein
MCGKESAQPAGSSLIPANVDNIDLLDLKERNIFDEIV